LNSGNNFNDKKTIAKNNKLTTIEWKKCMPIVWTLS
jgi:hypothetical protein